MTGGPPSNDGIARWRERLALTLGAVVAIGGIAYALYYVAVAVHEGTLSMTSDEPPPTDQDQVRERTLQRNQPVYFIGSSTIARFPLAELFPARSCVNLGAGNETAIQLRDRLRSEGLELPAAIVLYAGSADHNFDASVSPAEIRNRVEGLIDDLRAKADAGVAAVGKRGIRLENPITILLLEALPARKQSPAERSALDAINRELANLAATRRLDFLRTNRPPLTDENGDLAESMSMDRNHLNGDGYRILARWIVEEGGAVGDLLR